ncbi:MAG: asparagine synthase (glutamine-hydrolyzing) [Phycisphaerae bacterium]|nr:asparagine synthase (glutamine-hydrolyzing) [Gemmatimonadaceae bacterium]
MCGIAGFWRPSGSSTDISTRALVRMTDALSHRGPDADGHWVDADRGVALGHRRLSIVDLSPTGAQPMRSRTGRFTMVFNGEIYNFRRLRDELAALGASFRGTSDTEVMLAGFEQWGLSATLPRLAGMFAFAVWDSATDELWLARDRMGEKPLYLAQFAGQLAFASEIKSFRTLPDFPRDINPTAIATLLRQGYIGGEQSVYRCVTRLRPGSYAVVSSRGGQPHIRSEQYWNVLNELRSPNGAASQVTDTEATNSLDALLTEVVGEEMVADVPVGAFLSGGIDSSLIVSLMQKVASQPVRTFTIGFRENSHDESPFARAVANHLGTAHTEIMLSADDALAFVERLPVIFDEPFADSSQLPTLLVSSVTRQHVTVALSGDGGDELFGGYSQYTSPDSVGSLIGRVPRALRVPLSATLGAAPDALVNSVLTRGSSWAPNTRARLLRELRNNSRANSYESLLAKWVSPADIMATQHAGSFPATVPDSEWPRAASEPEARMAYDMQHYLPDDILVKVDRSAMACSLETRAPLIDHRVVKFAVQQPLSMKIRDGRGKFLLRNLLARYIPQQMIDRPKRGFAIPINDWLRGPLKDWGSAVLQNDAVLQDWFRPGVVSDMWAAHQRGEDHAERLWPVLMAMQWLRAERM